MRLLLHSGRCNAEEHPLGFPRNINTSAEMAPGNTTHNNTDAIYQSYQPDENTGSPHNATGSTSYRSANMRPQADNGNVR